MPDNERTSEMLRRLVALVAENGLAELTVEEDGVVISVKGLPDAPPAVVSVPLHPHVLPPTETPPYPQTITTAPAATTPAPPSAPASTTRVAFESPMMGVFYRSQAPTDPPLVSVGDVISVGQTVGLIEAMKVYSELPSEVAGRVVEIVIENGKMVRQGQPILYVEPA